MLRDKGVCKKQLAFQSPISPKEKPPSRHARQPRRPHGPTLAFKNFGDSLLDYMEAGPKLRKWYGEGERKPGKQRPEPEDEEEGPSGDAVLVTDAESSIGELVLLQLILARLKVAALVNNPAAAVHAYGSYVTPIGGSIEDRASLQKALRKSRAVICTGKLGALPELLQDKKLKHIVLLSSVGAEGLGLLGRLLGGDQAVLADERRESALQGCNAPLTVVRVGRLVDSPGGSSELNLVQGGSVPSGNVSREDAAQILVRALQKPPQATLEVAVESKPQRTQFRDWDKLFANVDEAV